MSTYIVSIRAPLLAVVLAVGTGHLEAGDGPAAATARNASRPDAPTAEQVAFFERQIRPVLVERCYKCHSEKAKDLKGGLRLDRRDTLLRGGDSGPALVVGDPDESLLIQALRRVELKMPPDEELPDRVVADFAKWVAMGAPDPRVRGDRAPESPGRDAARRHWAFQPVEQPSIPAVSDQGWPVSDIDRFILERLESEGLAPAKDADRYTWLRRVSFDLTGLPPTLEEMDAFVADESPTAWEEVVDRLLGSTAFGERWSRYWLDLVGYADQRTAEAPMYAHHAWRYRDFVIDSFNNDVPFDRLIRQQLAGDLLPHGSVQERRENLIATGFLVLGDMRISDYDKMQLHVDTVDSQVRKVGKAFLGLTLGCARCHDHKFDPISQDDYYAIAGIFDSTSTFYRATVGIWSEVNDIELPETPEQVAERIEAENQHARELIGLNVEMDRHQERLEELNEALEKDDERRKQEREARQAEKKAAEEKVGEDSSADDNEKSEEGSDESKKADPLEKLRAEREELNKVIAKLQHVMDHAQLFISRIPLTYGVRDVPEPSDMRITIRGNPRALGPVVPRGVLSVLPTRSEAIPDGQSGRMQLAQWLASPENPLTPRVTVNRIWQKLIGVGLHRNVDYCGLPEGGPSHPELLDYLASSFMRNGWSQKKVIRAIALSRTYRMSSQHNSRAHEVDPDNRLVWRMNRGRMDAEALRDALLSVSGKLQQFSGGPTFPFDIPENVVNIGRVRSIVNPPFFRLTKFHPQTEFYRTVYLPIIRGPLQPEMADLRNVFDFTSPAQTAGQRNVTTVPTQALYLMNSPQIKRYAQQVADRIEGEAETDEERVRRVWRIVLNRPVTAREERKAAEFLSQTDDDAWRELCHALIVSGEFLMRI